MTDVTTDMVVTKEETFGPVAPLYRFKSEAEAVKMADDTEFGLASYFYSRDIGRSWRLPRRLDTDAMHFAAQRPRDRRDVLAADTGRTARFLLGMVAEGVMWMPVHSALTCAVHTEDDIDTALSTAERVITLLGAAA